MRKIKMILANILFLSCVSVTSAYAYGYITSFNLSTCRSTFCTDNLCATAYTNTSGTNLYSKTEMKTKNASSVTSVSNNGKSKVSATYGDKFYSLKVTSKHYSKDQYSTLTR